jgi:energy-coupling factor transporter transmembrane protein EcfT
VHPSTWLVVWFVMVVLIQSLEGSLLAAALLVLPLFGGPLLRRCGQLAWRARWLFLSLFVILAWGGAGEPAWDGTMAPSLEGLSDASSHVGRLLLVLMAVTVLREGMPLADLLSGARRLLTPLRQCGLETDRGLVRLLLVLRHIETMPRPRDWRLLLDVPEHFMSEVFELADRPLCRRDYLIIAIAVVSILFYLRQA